MEYREEIYKMPFYMTYPMQNLYMMEMEYERDMERMKELYPREVQQLREMIEKRCDEMEYDGSRIYDENPDRFMLEEEVRRLLEKFLRENPQFGYMRPQGSPPRPMPRPEDMRPDMPPRPMPRPEDMRPDMPPRPMPRPEDMRPDMPPRPMPRPEDMRPDMPPRPMPRMGDGLEAQQRWEGEQPWLRSLISILFHDEIYRRRCRHRRCRRWW